MLTLADKKPKADKTSSVYLNHTQPVFRFPQMSHYYFSHLLQTQPVTTHCI